MTTNTDLKARATEATSRYLKRRGYTILNKNWKCEAGKIEVVANDGDTLVFVKVLVSEDPSMGFPKETITPKRRSKTKRSRSHTSAVTPTPISPSDLTSYRSWYWALTRQ